MMMDHFPLKVLGAALFPSFVRTDRVRFILSLLVLKGFVQTSLSSQRGGFGRNSQKSMTEKIVREFSTECCATDYGRRSL